MKKYLVSLLAVSALVASCAKDDATNGGNGVTPGKDYFAVSTAVKDATLSVGDSVGVCVQTMTKDGLDTTDFISNEGMVVSQSGLLVSENLYKYLDEATTLYDVTVYAPYDAELRNDSLIVDIDVPVDQAAEDFDWQADDYLFASTLTTAKRYIELEMQHIMSMVTLNVKVEGSAAETAKVSTALRLATSMTASLKGNGEVLSTGAAKVITPTADNEALVVPQTIAAGTVFAGATIVVGENEYTLPISLADEVVLHSGQNLVVNVKVDSKDLSVISDLSLSYGEWKEGVKQTVAPVMTYDLSAAGTANCYIVSTPGRYKFKATVMGNGASTTGITPAAINPVTARLSWQVLAAGKYNGSTSVYGTEYGQEMKACIVKSSIEVKDGYVYFDTPATIIPSNCVIDALDADGNIVWSWHIWVSPNVNADDMAVEIDNAKVSGVTMMDRNLGAYGNGNKGATKADAYAARGMVYQWGRKDPFFTSNATDGTKYANWWNYDPAVDSLKEWNSSVPVASTADIYKEGAWSIFDGVKYAVAHPSTFIGGNYSINGGMWVCGAEKQTSWSLDTSLSGDDKIKSVQWGALWGNTAPGKDSCTVVGVGKKTIFDPCPTGWRVPEAGAFRFWMSTDTSGYPAWIGAGNIWKYNIMSDSYASAPADGSIYLPISIYYGMNFYTKGVRTAEGLPANTETMFFPAIMGRNYVGGLANSDSNIEIMTNSACQNVDNNANFYKNLRVYMTNSGYCWFTDSGSWYDQQACALPVRCVKE